MGINGFTALFCNKENEQSLPVYEELTRMVGPDGSGGPGTLLELLNNIEKGLGEVDEVHNNVIAVKRCMMAYAEKMIALRLNRSNKGMGPIKEQQEEMKLRVKFQNSMETLSQDFERLRKGELVNQTPPSTLELMGMKAIEESMAHPIENANNYVENVLNDVKNVLDDEKFDIESCDYDEGSESEVERAIAYLKGKGVVGMGDVYQTEVSKFIAKEFIENKNNIFDFVEDINSDIFDSICSEFFVDKQRTILNEQAFENAGLRAELNHIKKDTEGNDCSQREQLLKANEMLARMSSYLTTASLTTSKNLEAGANTFSEAIDERLRNMSGKPDAYIKASLNGGLGKKQRRVRTLKKQKNTVEKQLKLCNKQKDLCKFESLPDEFMNLDEKQEIESLKSELETMKCEDACRGLDIEKFEPEELEKFIWMLAEKKEVLESKLDNTNGEIEALATPEDTVLAGSTPTGNEQKKNNTSGWKERGRNQVNAESYKQGKQEKQEKKEETEEEQQPRGPS